MTYRLTRIFLLIFLYVFIYSLIVSAASSEKTGSDDVKDYTYIKDHDVLDSEKDKISDDENSESYKPSEDTTVIDEKYSKILGSLESVDDTEKPSLDCSVISDSLVVKINPPSESKKVVVSALGETHEINDKTSSVSIPIPKSVKSTYNTITVKAEIKDAAEKEVTVITKNVNLRSTYNPVLNLLYSNGRDNPYHTLYLILNLPIYNK